MTRVRLGPDGAEVRSSKKPVHRARLSVEDLEHFASACGVASPIHDLVGQEDALSPLAHRLGGSVAPKERVSVAPGDTGPMRASGLIAEDGTATDLGRAVLAVWQVPTLEVATQLVVDTGRGRARILARHRTVGSWVVCLSTADGRSFELAWLDAEDWWLELARLAHVETSALAPARGLDALPAVIETPWELLVATGEAITSDRPHLVEPLVSAHAGLTLGGMSTDALVPATDAEAAAWLGLLERGSRGTLQATVAGAAVGTVGWVLFPDGWRSLSPLVRDGWHTVRVERQSAIGLGREVAVRAAAVVG